MLVVLAKKKHIWWLAIFVKRPLTNADGFHFQIYTKTHRISQCIFHDCNLTTAANHFSTNSHTMNTLLVEALLLQLIVLHLNLSCASSSFKYAFLIEIISNKTPTDPYSSQGFFRQKDSDCIILVLLLQTNSSVWCNCVLIQHPQSIFLYFNVSQLLHHGRSISHFHISKIKSTKDLS